MNTGKELLDAAQSYVAYCTDNKRVPNTAGFCFFLKLRREDYFLLRQKFPQEFGICEMELVDAAVNAKVPNTGTALQYLLTAVDGVDLAAGAGVICGQPEEDGE